MTVGGKRSEQMHEKVVWTAMTRVFNLADILELINDRLDDRALAQEQLVAEREQTRVHILAQFGDEMQPLGDEQVLGELLRDVAPITKELAK